MPSVAADYRHRDKLITPGEGIVFGGGRFKWYDIAPADESVPAEINALARAYLARQHVDFADEFGFIILHRCGADFYFLLVSTWRGNNEIWETVLAKQSDAEPDFAPFPQGSPHRGTFCVWELGAVWHEQQAWKRYLTSTRDAAARQSYLNDRYSGAV